MSGEFYGNTVLEAMRSAVGRSANGYGVSERKSRFQVWAPPLTWGPWVTIYSQFGVTGANADQHVTRLNVSFDSASNAKSTFDLEIKGGDNFIRSYGPGDETVRISGNVATSIQVRLKSHTVGQNVTVSVG